MNRSNFLKTASTFAIAVGFLVTGASADSRRDNVGRTIAQLERATGSLVASFSHELKDRGLWKPQGAYARLFKRVATLENQGDNLLKYYKRGKSYAYLAKAVAITKRNAHEAADLARRIRVSRGTVSGINRVSSMLHSLSGLCGESHRSPRARYSEKRYESNDGRRNRRDVPIRQAYREIRRIF